MRNTWKNTMLGMALVAGLLGTGAAAANAAPQEFRGRPEARFDGGRERGFYRPEEHRVYGGEFRYAGRPVVEGYIPPCPGDGYFWNAGYYNGGIWIPGAWRFRGEREFGRGYGYGPVAHFDGGRHFEGGRGYGHGFERGGRR